MLSTRFYGGGRLYLLIFSILISSLCVRQAIAEGTRLSLKDATALTLGRSPQLYQYRFVTEVEQAQRQLSALTPSLTLDVELENVFGSGDYQGLNNAEATVALSSVIEMGNKRSARLSLSEARIYQTQWQRQAETMDILGDLTRTYIEGLFTQNNIILAEDSLRFSQQLVRTVKNKVEQGAAPEAELMRANATVAEAEIRLSALTSQFERQKIQLARFWGDENPQFTGFDGDLFAFDSSEEFEVLYLRVQNSPAMEVFASDIRIKSAEVVLAQSNSRADISWQVGVRRLEETRESAFTAGISIPLFANKRSNVGVASAMAEREALSYSKQDRLLQLRTNLYEAWSLRQQSIDAVNVTQQRIIPALEKALQLTEQAYENGRYQYFDLVLAQEELLAAKQSLIEAASNAHLNQALIEQLTSEPLTQ